MTTDRKCTDCYWCGKRGSPGIIECRYPVPATVNCTFINTGAASYCKTFKFAADGALEDAQHAVVRMKP